MKKRDLLYFLVFIVSYMVLNFCLAHIPGITFNSYVEGHITIGTYHFLRLAEFVIITALCFIKRFKSFIKPLIYFDLCVAISWIFDTFCNFVLFEKSISLIYVTLAMIITIVCMLSYIAEGISRVLNKIECYKKYKPYIFMTTFILLNGLCAQFIYAS